MQACVVLQRLLVPPPCSLHPEESWSLSYLIYMLISGYDIHQYLNKRIHATRNIYTCCFVCGRQRGRIERWTLETSGVRRDCAIFNEKKARPIFSIFSAKHFYKEEMKGKQEKEKGEKKTEKRQMGGNFSLKNTCIPCFLNTEERRRGRGEIPLFFLLRPGLRSVPSAAVQRRGRPLG